MPTHADQHLHLRMTPKHAPVHINFLIKVLGAHIIHEVLSNTCDLQGRWYCTPKIKFLLSQQHGDVQEHQALEPVLAAVTR